jgi:hypothetical protein
MTNFVWSAKTREGKSVHQDAPAETLAQSKEWMMAEGFTDLVLVEDEIMATAAKGFAEKTFFLGEELEITPEARKKGREQPPASLLRTLIDSFKEDKGLYLIALFFTLYSWWRGNPVGAIISIAALIAWLVFRYWVAAPLVLYQKINQAKDWHRWPEVMVLVGKAEKLRNSHFIKLPETELIKIRAQSLAGTGRLPEALTLFQRCKGRPDCPDWMFKSGISGLYEIVQQYDAGFEYTLQAAQESPSTMIYLDVMNYYLRRKRNATAARAALAKVDAESIPQAGRFFIHRCHGILAYIEGNYAAARQELEKSLAMVESQKALPFRDGSLAILKAYLACVCGRQGEMERARKYFAAAEPYLIATEEKDFICECKMILGRV